MKEIYKVSRKEAIERSVKAWKWLARHPTKDKSDYAKRKDPHMAGIKHECWMCEWSSQQSESYCKGCPLNLGNRTCSNDHYINWVLAESTQEKRHHAACIAIILRDALKKYNK